MTFWGETCKNSCPVSELSTSACSVQFEAVVKKFGDGPTVLQDINFTAQPGDFVAIIGPSGCGKSTLLRLLAGLAPLTSGEIRIDGKLPRQNPAEVAYVFQDPTLMPWARVSTNVELPLKLRGILPQQRGEIVERCLAQVQLSDRADAFPRQLSGGQQMRVSIARALALDPQLLLLDEPFGSLDEMTRNYLNQELLKLRGEANWTAFFVTHSVAEAVFLANRVIVLSANPGKIAQEVKIDLPYPRLETTRTEPRFLELTSELSKCLRSTYAPQK